MRQSVPVDLAKLSHKQMGCELVNATQVPSDSGNATVQLAAYPDLQTKLNLQFKIVAAYECFQYIIVFLLQDEEIPFIYCNAYSHHGELIKQNIIPSDYYDGDLRPNAVEFIGSYGYVKAASRVYEKNTFRNLTYNQLTQLNTSNGLPAGYWNGSTYYLYEPGAYYVQNGNTYGYRTPLGTFVEITSDYIMYDPTVDSCGCKCCAFGQSLYTVNFSNCSAMPVEDGDLHNWIVINRNKQVYVVDADFLDKSYYNYELTDQSSSVKYFFEVLDETDDGIDFYENAYLVKDAYGNSMFWNGTSQKYDYIRFLGDEPPGIPMFTPFEKSYEDFLRDAGGSGGLWGGLRIVSARRSYNNARKSWLASQQGKTVFPTRKTTNGCFQLFIPNNEEIISIDTFYSMLVLVSTKKVLWYSTVGTLKIEGLNYYETEYLNSQPLAVWRVANRFVVITDRVIQFWDWTGNFESPIAPQFQSGTFSFRVLPYSVTRYQDTLYFLASTLETPALSLYSLSKVGAFERLSNPVLDAYINESLPSAPNALNLFSAISQFYSIDLIEWKVDDVVIVFNPAFKTFFEAKFIYIYAGKVWLKRDYTDVGSLDSYVNSSEVKTYNTNFEGKLRAIRGVFLDHDCTGDLRELLFTIDRVAGQSIISNRQVKMIPFSGRKNIRTRLNGLGSGTDLSIGVKWVGFNKINNFNMEVE